MSGQSESHSQEAAGGLPIPHLDGATAREIVRGAVARYFADRRDRIPAFVDQHFSITGAWRLNRKAWGKDLVRAPVNTFMAGPNLAMRGLARSAERAGKYRTAAWLRRNTIVLDTDVRREIAWLLYSELLELPYAEQGGAGRSAKTDALAQAIVSDPRLASALEPGLIFAAKQLAEPGGRAWLEKTVEDYLGARVATAEVVALLTTISAGAGIAHAFTPGAISLGPAMASAVAPHVTTTSVTMSSALTALWAGAAAAAPGGALTVAATGTALAGAAAVSAFAGVVADPVQRWTGLHEKRLTAFVDVLEGNLLGETPGRSYKVVDAYVGRLMDLTDVLVAVMRHARI